MAARTPPLPRRVLARSPAGEQNSVTVVDVITGRLYATVSTLRLIHDAVDKGDPTSADLLHTIIDTLEKHAWMLCAENRTA